MMKIGIKRIAFALIGTLLLMASCDSKIRDNEDDSKGKPKGDTNSVVVSILVPQGVATTYATEDGTIAENIIDSLWIVLNTNLVVDTFAFGGNDLTKSGANDSIYNVKFEYDRMSQTATTANIFANFIKPKTHSSSTSRIPPPTQGGIRDNYFFMSGKINSAAQWTPPTSSDIYYRSEVSLERNVAKLRIVVTEHPARLPADLTVDFSSIKVGINNMPDKTNEFSGSASNPTTTNFVTIAESSVSSPYQSSPGGQVDSIYIHENLDTNNKTEVVISLKTQSSQGGVKEFTKSFTLTGVTGDKILRNYIYTLKISVRGESLDPVVALDVTPWTDVAVNGDVLGTYLTTNTSEIEFDSNNNATINFCTDAQAIYFDFLDVREEVRNGSLKTINIDTNYIPGLTPSPTIQTTIGGAWQTGGQILMHQNRCGSFGFHRTNNNMSGRIRICAGNIVKYLNFPQKSNAYDAHFIVGDTLFGSIPYTSAKIELLDDVSSDWLKLSKGSSGAYPGPGSNLVGSAGNQQQSLGGPVTVYLQLDENYSFGKERSGIVTLYNSLVEKKFYITQLPAIKVGSYIYKDGNDLKIGTLYTEHMYEYEHMPKYNNSSYSIPASNNVYYGFNSINEANNYEAINYCAKKYQDSPTNRWYLPSQGELVAIWLAYDTIKTLLAPDTTYFNYNTTPNNRDELYWSATADNINGYQSAQYMSFLYGNVGHRRMEKQTHARCVRLVNPTTFTSSPYITYNVAGYYEIDFAGLSLPTRSGNNAQPHNEDDLANSRVCRKLYVQDKDQSGGVMTWTAAQNSCNAIASGGWRLPTQRELQAIWIYQQAFQTTHQLKDYYWSGTGSLKTDTGTGTGATNAWMVGGSGLPGESGNAPHELKTKVAASARCVKEAP